MKILRPDFEKGGLCIGIIACSLTISWTLLAYVLDRKKLPRNLPGHYGFGDENEAVIYAHGNRAAWKATPGALEWFAARVK